MKWLLTLPAGMPTAHCAAFSAWVKRSDTVAVVCSHAVSLSAALAPMQMELTGSSR